MKVSIGTNIKEGPWGGGNLFAINIKKYLETKGHKVVTDLNDSDIDIILLTEPRRTSESSAYTHIDVENYLNYINGRTLVVHRVNECDERKNTNYVNKYLIEANKVADYTVFVSTWLRDIYEEQGINKKQNHVILAGADRAIFNEKGRASWNQEEKLKIVTHHWGANWNKGFDIYSKLDNLLEESFYKNYFEFTYIGNLPKNFSFKNTKVIKPLSGSNLAKEIKKNHVYLTASLNEPSGNHHIEGAQCGLPVLYINSGGIPEYCHGFGLEFNKDNFSEILEEMRTNYDKHLKHMEKYPFNSQNMCKAFERMFNDMLEKRDNILSKRNLINKQNTIARRIYLARRKLKLTKSK